MHGRAGTPGDPDTATKSMLGAEQLRWVTTGSAVTLVARDWRGDELLRHEVAIPTGGPRP